MSDAPRRGARLRPPFSAQRERQGQQRNGIVISDTDRDPRALMQMISGDLPQDFERLRPGLVRSSESVADLVLGPGLIIQTLIEVEAQHGRSTLEVTLASTSDGAGSRAGKTSSVRQRTEQRRLQGLSLLNDRLTDLLIDFPGQSHRALLLLGCSQKKQPRLRAVPLLCGARPR